MVKDSSVSSKEMFTKMAFRLSIFMPQMKGKPHKRNITEAWITHLHHTLLEGDTNMPLSPGLTDINKTELTDIMNKTNLPTFYRTLHLDAKNVPFSQHLMDHFPKLTKYSLIKQLSTLRENWNKPLASYHTTMN